MDSSHFQASSLREALSSLSLEPADTEATRITKRVLLGKILSVRSFKRFTLSDIIKNSWKLRGRVRIEKLDENTFKFNFSRREDKTSVFNRRPWTMDGAHLILKEWPTEMALQDVDFTTSTFFMQVHGLPPNLLHPGIALKIGQQIGGIHTFSVSSRSVVEQRYLRFQIDLQINNPIPAGFFQKRKEGVEIWIQFKFEKLPDFCFRCGMLDHVTGRCKYAEPATVVNMVGVVSRLYGPWIREKVAGGTSFSNLSVSSGRVERVLAESEAYSMTVTNLTESLTPVRAGAAGTSIDTEVVDGGQVKWVNRTHAGRDTFESTKASCPKIKALGLTIQQRFSAGREDFQKLVLEKVSRDHYNHSQLRF